jgi:hypothetical protein
MLLNVPTPKLLSAYAAKDFLANEINSLMISLKMALF